MALRQGESTGTTPAAAPPPAPPAPSNHVWDRGLRILDRAQARVKPVAFVLAVLKKAGEDQVSLLAAVMSHFGMLSVFPLLLLLVTIGGFLFRDDRAAQRALVDAALQNFPVLGDYLRASIQSLPGSGIALVFGAVLLAWASLGFTKTAQTAMADVWTVPRRLRPGFWQHLGRSVWALVMLGLPTLLTAALTIVSPFLARNSGRMANIPHWLSQGLTVGVAAALLTLVVTVNFASHLLAFRALTPKTVSMRDLFFGTALFTVFWLLVTAFGSALLANRLARANQLYGTLGFIIGLIFWIYLGAFGSLLAAEVNSVRAKRLFPRTLFGPPRTAVDHRALRARARTEELAHGQVVEVRFEDPFDANASGQSDGRGGDGR